MINVFTFRPLFIGIELWTDFILDSLSFFHFLVILTLLRRSEFVNSHFLLLWTFYWLKSAWLWLITWLYWLQIQVVHIISIINHRFIPFLFVFHFLYCLNQFLIITFLLRIISCLQLLWLLSSWGWALNLVRIIIL